MPRTHTRVLHEITCRGCGATFQNHNRNRAYCHIACKFLYTSAQSWSCDGCGANDRPEIVLYSSLEVKIDDEKQRRAFAIQHQECRRLWLDNHERTLTCDCKRCRAEAGLEPATPMTFENPDRVPRSTGYRRHASAVYERDGYICQICELPTMPNAHPSDDMYPTLDHELRLQDGGSDALGNLRTAHRWCNIKREGIWEWSGDYAIRYQARLRFVDRIA